MLIFESNGCSDCKSSNTRSMTVSGNNFSSLYPTSVLISLKNLRSSEVKGSCERLAKIPLSTTRLFTSAEISSCKSFDNASNISPNAFDCSSSLAPLRTKSAKCAL